MNREDFLQNCFVFILCLVPFQRDFEPPKVESAESYPYIQKWSPAEYNTMHPHLGTYKDKYAVSSVNSSVIIGCTETRSKVEPGAYCHWQQDMYSGCVTI
jgi:hypothetical protein